VKEVLQFIQEGGSVVRYHTRPGIKPDTDAHHSHGVAMLCEILSGRTNNSSAAAQASANLLLAALTHDLGEQLTGDVSSPAKRFLGLGNRLKVAESEVRDKYNLNIETQLTREEQIILNIADAFDGMMYCCRELALGNKNMLLVWRRFCDYAETFSADENLPIDVALRASNMYEAIKEIYHEVTSPGGPDFDVFGSK
jgi:5'-deoxynucleotidase YfbR-like HD superfamily hydrolase